MKKTDARKDLVRRIREMMIEEMIDLKDKKSQLLLRERSLRE